MDRPSSFDRSHLLSLQQFVAHTNEHAGATMHANTGRLLGAREPGVLVGKEPDTQGVPVPSTEVPGPLGLGDAHQAWIRTRILTGGAPHIHFGSWRNDAGNFDLDAVGSYDRETAVKLGRRRKEKAVWDNENMQEIRTDR